MHAAGYKDAGAFKVLLAADAVLLWANLLHFAKAFRGTGTPSRAPDSRFTIGCRRSFLEEKPVWKENQVLGLQQYRFQGNQINYEFILQLRSRQLLGNLI